MSNQWLPDLILLSEFDGDWEKYLEALHSIFQKEFVDSKPSWPNKRVGLKRHPEFDNKSATFWHMISTGSSEEDRIPDLRRCERICWPRPIMEEYDQLDCKISTSRIIWWEEERNNEKRILLSLKDFSYVMVIVDRGKYVLPWTAYPVERKHQQQKLQKRHEEFWRGVEAGAAQKDDPVTPSTHG